MKKTLSNLWARTADAMRSKPSIDEMAELEREITVRLGEIENRIPQIRSDGFERRKLLETGTPEDLVAMDEELATLQAEESQLRFRSGELHKRRRKAIADTGVRDASKTRAELAEAVQEAVQAEEVFLTVRREAEAIANRISAARAAARTEKIEGRDACYGDTEDLAKLARILYPGNGLEILQRRFDWAREKAKSLREAKLVAQDGAEMPAGASVNMRRYWLPNKGPAA